MLLMRRSNWSAGTALNSSAAMQRLLMMMPAELTPIAAMRGRGGAGGVGGRRVGRRLADRVVDAVEVVLRVGVDLGLPDGLGGKHFLPVDHRRDLPVGAAGVKADAAAPEGGRPPAAPGPS